jgi:ATP-dependent Clp protease adapter protein ClpS
MDPRGWGASAFVGAIVRLGGPLANRLRMCGLIRAYETRPLPDDDPTPKPRLAMINDETTPIGFVVELLVRRAGLDEHEAARVANTAHYRGCCTIPFAEGEQAETIARAIRADAASAGHPLVVEVDAA